MKHYFESFRNLEDELENNLLQSLTNHILPYDPEWLKKIQPSKRENVQQLKQLVRRQFNQELPCTYEMYLTYMGQEDNGLLSKNLDDELEEWKYFSGGDMALGAKEQIEEILEDGDLGVDSSEAPPFWHFYYAAIQEEGYGFSPVTKDPEQIVMTIGNKMYYTHDTFRKLLFSCIYLHMLRWTTDHGKIIANPEDCFFKNPKGMYYLQFHFDAPEEWEQCGCKKLVQVLSELEDIFSIRECWFSSKKEFNLFDLKDRISDTRYNLSRYVGICTNVDLTIRIKYRYWGLILVELLGNGVYLMKRMMSFFEQYAKVQDFTLKKITGNR